MTSGIFSSTPISSIIVSREARQRRSLEEIEALANSIRRVGLIHPILIRREDNSLVVGERRLEACKLLGWTHIPTQFEDEADELELQALELEENIQRLDIPWADEVAAVEKYHQLKLKLDPEWTTAKTAEALGVDSTTVTTKLAVAKEVRANPAIAKIPTYSTARNLVSRLEDRRGNSILKEIEDFLPPVEPTVPVGPVLNQSFLEWAPLYDGSKFNFIHCDFPYGINANKMQQGTTVTEFGGYADSEDVYWELLQCFAKTLDYFCEPSAHLIFWFSMKLYVPTVEFLRKETDFVIDDFPLIWHKTDNKGLLPDPQRGPRRLYETALFGIRGDRKVAAAGISNIVGAGLGERVHMSQKPVPVLTHFFKMVVDNTTKMLDPTCGSGSALIAAEGAGANKVVGLEINSEFAERANEEVRKSREEREK